MKRIKRIILTFICLLYASISFGNTGVFSGSGNQVIPIKSNQIQLVRENVKIKLSIGKSNGQYGVPFIPWANVTAKFYLRNISQDEVSLQVGFPFLDLQGFGDEKFVIDNMNFTVISNGTKKEYKIKEGLIEKEFDPEGYFKKVFAWDEKFNPSEKKEVVVSYKLLMSIASANSVMRGYDDQEMKFSNIDNLFPALSYNFDYITKTAYTWAGDVEEAIFELDCTAFYQELEQKYYIKDIKKMGGHTRPIVWESVYPDSSKAESGLYQWKFSKKIPEEGLFYELITFFLPSKPEEVKKYFSEIQKHLKEVSKEEYLSIAKSYYQIIASDKKPSDEFSQKYFEKVDWINGKKIFINDVDKKNIIEIANTFKKLVDE